jgi:hypothetical protein
MVLLRLGQLLPGEDERTLLGVGCAFSRSRSTSSPSFPLSGTDLSTGMCAVPNRDAADEFGGGGWAWPNGELLKGSESLAAWYFCGTMIGRDTTHYPSIQPRSASQHQVYSDDILMHSTYLKQSTRRRQKENAAAATVVVSMD